VDGVEEDGGAEAFVIEVGDGRFGSGACGEAIVAKGDGLVAKVAGCFVAGVLELEGVVGANFAGGLEVEEFLVELAVVEVSDTAEVEAETVERTHAEGGVFAEVVGVFDPVGEVVVELFEVGDVFEVLVEILITNGAEEAFDFSFCGAVAYGCVDENGAEAGADLMEFFGGVVGAVVGVDGLGDATFVEGALEALDEVLGVVVIEELGVGDDA